MAKAIKRKSLIKASMKAKHVADQAALDALLPDKPTPKHTILITCTEPGCSLKRWVKPQDAHQVKRCRSCQERIKKGKSLARLPAVIAKAEAKAELATREFYMPKREVLHYHWATPQELAEARKGVKRVWP